MLYEVITFSLYEDLTVSENIKLYAGIYGISAKKRKAKEAERPFCTMTHPIPDVV